MILKETISNPILKSYYSYQDFMSHKMKFLKVLCEIMDFKILMHEDVTTYMIFDLALRKYGQIITYKFRKGSCVKIERKCHIIEKKNNTPNSFYSRIL